MAWAAAAPRSIGVLRGVLVALLAALVLAPGAFAGPPPSPAPLIVNGGFEQPDVATGKFELLPGIPGWTLESGDAIEVQDRVFGWTPAEGDQHVELDAKTNARISQTVATTKGQRYRIVFWHSPRPGQPASTNGLTVYWNGKKVGTVEGRQGGADTEWLQTKITVEASSETSTLEFQGEGTSNSLGEFIDEVSLEPVATPPPVVETKEIPAPNPGETAKVKFPVGKTSTEATVTVSGETDGLGAAFSEKAKKLKRKKQIQQRLLTTCWPFFHVEDSEQFGERLEAVEIPGEGARLARICLVLFAAIQKQIDELEAQLDESARSPHGAVGEAAGSCLVERVGLRLVKRAGKRPVVKIVGKAKPRLRMSCEATEDGLELTIRRRGKGTLRQAVGKNLALTVRRSDAAPAPDPEATLTFSYTQQ